MYDKETKNMVCGFSVNVYPARGFMESAFEFLL